MAKISFVKFSRDRKIRLRVRNEGDGERTEGERGERWVAGGRDRARRRYLYGKVKSTERRAATKHGWPLRIY